MKNFVENQRKKLIEEKEKLEKKILELEKFPDYGRGDDDNAREFEDYENNLSIELQLKTLLKKVNLALNSINKDSYGKCSICKKEIEKNRLALIPYADICVTCKKNGKK